MTRAIYRIDYKSDKSSCVYFHGVSASDETQALQKFNSNWPGYEVVRISVWQRY